MRLSLLNKSLPSHPPFQLFFSGQIPLKTRGVCWFDPQLRRYKKTTIAAHAPAVTFFSANQCRALGKRKHTCCPVKPLFFRLRYRPHSSGSGAVSQVLESPSECPFGTQGHQELYKEIQRITESPRKCLWSITIRPCCQGIFEATSTKNEQETWT